MEKKLIIENQNKKNSIWFINHPGCIYRKNIIRAIKGYPNYPVCHDLAMWLNLFNSGAKICNVEESLIYYRKHENSLTFTIDRKKEHEVIMQNYWKGIK